MPIFITYFKNSLFLIFVLTSLFFVIYCKNTYSSLLEFKNKKNAFSIMLTINSLTLLGLIPLYLYKQKSMDQNLELIFLLIAILFLFPTQIVFNKIKIDNMLITRNAIGNNPINIKNKGYISKQGDYIYYSYFGKQYSFEKGLYASKINNDNEIIPMFGFCQIKLASGYVNNINVVGEFIYYTKYNKKLKCYDIYKYKIGKTISKLIMRNCNFVNIVSNNIYYLNYENYGSADSVEKKQGYIFCMNLIDNTIEQVCFKMCDNYILDKNKIYFTNESGVFYIDLCEKLIKTIINFVPHYYYVHENDMYYSIYDSEKNETIIYKSINCREIHKIISFNEEIIEFVLMNNIIIYLTLFEEVVSYDLEKNIKDHIAFKISHIYSFDCKVLLGWNAKEVINLYF